MSAPGGGDSPSQFQTKRCAIYSRSSVEKNDQDPFDSVNAQFMACAEYIGSQIGRGWTLVNTLYEDRGFSGSDLQRPGLQSLITDIKYGLVDVVVVHRLDRLTRSLSDFQKLMSEFNNSPTTGPFHCFNNALHCVSFIMPPLPCSYTMQIGFSLVAVLFL